MNPNDEPSLDHEKFVQKHGSYTTVIVFFLVAFFVPFFFISRSSEPEEPPPPPKVKALGVPLKPTVVIKGEVHRTSERPPRFMELEGFGDYQPPMQETEVGILRWVYDLFKRFTLPGQATDYLLEEEQDEVVKGQLDELEKSGKGLIK